MEVSKFVGCNENDISLVRNTTSGINSIVTSLGDRIKSTLLLSHVYAAMKNTMNMHVEKYKSNIVTLDINLPITSSNMIVQKFKETLEMNPDINFAIIGMYNTVCFY